MGKAERSRILVVDDDASTATLVRRIIESQMEEVDVNTAHSGWEAYELIRTLEPNLVISDLLMPDMSGIELYEKVRVHTDVAFIILTGRGTMETAIEALRAGVFDYITKPARPDEIVKVVSSAFRYDKLLRENRSLRAQITKEQALEERIIFRSKQMTELMELMRMVARSEATVLIRGESGTGKELAASTLHWCSSRAKGPFVKVNCAAIPENLLESELFGYEAGAFTDARTMKKGKFEQAHLGTVFLDEIGDMSPSLQVRILRVLQEREVERLGGDRPIEVDVRLVCATNQDLEELIEEGKFREDLYYRINVIPIHLPPLRDRKEDILLLATHFMRQFNDKNDKAFQGVSEAAQQILLQYPWPGNVRELQNAIERAVVLGLGDTIQPEHLPARLREAEPNTDDVIFRLFETDFSLDDLEKWAIERSLEKADWNQSKAARILGLTRRTLQYRLDKHNIVRAPAGAD